MADPTTPLDRSPRHRNVVARTLLLDLSAVRAVDLLARHGVPALLLKGRAVADWLYAGELRDYVDVDLLVDPDRRDQAVDLLSTVGYEHWLSGADGSEYGRYELELLGDHGVCIDLHHSLIGLRADPETCWRVLWERTEEIVVAGRQVRALDPPARTMHLALHAAQNGAADQKAAADLDRGLAVLPPSTWREALSLARTLDAVDAFSGGLHLRPAGRSLARALDLPPPRDVSVILRVSSVPQEALQFQHLLDTPGLPGRGRLVARKLWPTAVYMRSRSPLARRGVVGLLAARVQRAVGLPPTVRRAAADWMAARRAVARVESHHETTTRSAP